MRRSIVALASGTMIATLVASSGGADARPVAARAVAARSAVPAAYASAVSTPRVDSYYPSHGNAVVDALHYGLDLTWNRGRKSLSGIERLVFRAATSSSSIPLDLESNLRVTAATVDGRAVTPTQTGTHLGLNMPVRAGEVHTVALRYAGVPRPSPAPTTRDDIPALGFTAKRDGRAFTMQEPFGAFTWYAVNDQPADKALYDMTLHVAAPFVGVANGRLVGRRTAGGVTTTRWHLAQPAASYLTTVAFGRYRHTSLGKVHGVPLSFWTPTSRPALVKKLQFMRGAFRWLERLLGRYPFDSLSLVVVPSSSAMETQTMITEGNTRYALEDDNIVHEMSHQWYGDEVTPNDWRDVWMSEGMAMYVQYRWLDHITGRRVGSFVASNTRSFDNPLRRDYGPPGAYDAADFGEADVYLPPARMWWRLSQRMGPARFRRLLKRWPATHRYTSSSREVLADWWSAASGRDLHPFFHRWLLAKRDPS